MKDKQQINLNTLLILLTLAGVVVLYILFFITKRTADNSVPAASESPKVRAPLSIVFVNIDSLNEHYEFVKVLKRDLEGTGNRLQREVLAEQDALEKEAADFQRKMSANIMSEERARAVYEELMSRQQALMEKKDRYTQQIADQELSMNIRLLDTINVFLKRFNQSRKYDYILSFRTAGEILIANDTLDITSQVLELLNREYNERNK